MTVDVLAVGAHPDDADIGVGGTLLLSASRGAATAILDLTRGEASTRGTVEERARESASAAKILRVAERRNTALPDGRLANTTEFQRQIIPVIREFRPRVVLAPLANDRHPDHKAAHALIRDAVYFSGLRSIDTGQDAWRPPVVLYYTVYIDPVIPAAIVDISKHFQAKLEALRAYSSQLHNPAYNAPETFVSSEAFWKSIEARAAYWGGRIGVAYGEPLYGDGPIGLNGLPGLEAST
jgi:bacillithiol biosynthesis deacetylase BshB1